MIAENNSYEEDTKKHFYLDPQEDLTPICQLLPELTQIEYIIYQLSAGDILKKKQIEETFDILDFLTWNVYRQYESFVEDQMRTELQKNSK